MFEVYQSVFKGDSNAYLSHSHAVFNLFSEDGWQENQPSPKVNSCNAEKFYFHNHIHFSHSPT